MANPFKEAEKKNKKAPGSKQEPAVEQKEAAEVVETPAEPEKPVETLPEPVVEEKEPKSEKAKKVSTKPAKPVEEPKKDMFAGLKVEKPATGKTYAFYLSDENVDKLKAMAAEKGMSTSKLLDYILSEVL